MDFMKNPVSLCRKIFEYIREMTTLIQARLLKGGSGRSSAPSISSSHRLPRLDTLYHSETLDLCLRRCKAAPLRLNRAFSDLLSFD